MNQEIVDVQPRFGKDRGTRQKISNIHWILEKARGFQKGKKKKSASLTALKPLILCFTIDRE